MSIINTLQQALNEDPEYAVKGYDIVHALIWSRLFMPETVELGPYVILKSFYREEAAAATEAYLRQAEAAGNLEAQRAHASVVLSDIFYGKDPLIYYGDAPQLTDAEAVEAFRILAELVVKSWKLHLEAQYPEKLFSVLAYTTDDGGVAVGFHQQKSK
jgi:hypothetical protein